MTREGSDVFEHRLVADRIVTLVNGYLEQVGPSNALYDRPQNMFG